MSHGNLLSGYHHPALGPVRIQLQELPSDNEGQIAATIGLMYGLANEDSRNSRILEVAGMLVGRSNGLVERYLALVHKYVRSLIRFIRDENISIPITVPGEQVEVLIRPIDMLAAHIAIGDCDDYSMLVGALLGAAGIPWKFVTVAADSHQPGQFSHVYTVAYPEPGYRIPMDASHGKYAGWETDKGHRYKEWDNPMLMQGPGFGLPKYTHLGCDATGSGEDCGVNVGSGAGGSSIDWGNILNTSINWAGRILLPHYGQPSQQGTVVVGPGGTTYSTTGPGGIPYGGGIPGTGIGTGISTTTVLLLAAVGIAAVVAMKKG